MKTSNVTFIFDQPHQHIGWTCFTTNYDPDSENTGIGESPADALEAWLATNQSIEFDDLDKSPADNDSKSFTFDFEAGDVGTAKSGVICWEEGADGATDSNYTAGTGYTRIEALTSWLDSDFDNLNDLIDPEDETVDDLPALPHTIGNSKESQIRVICLAAMQLGHEAIDAGDTHRVDSIKAHALDRVMDVITDKAEQAPASSAGAAQS